MSKSELIRGAGGGGKSGGGSGRVAKEAKDSLRSRQYARVLDLVSEGEIEGLVNGLQSVYLDDTPIKNPDGTFNFDGVSFAYRPGTQSQSHIPDIPLVESEQNVGVEVKNDTPIVRSITDSNIDSARVTLSVPRLSKQDTTNGDIKGTSVRIAIDLQTDGGGYVTQIIGSDAVNLSSSGDEATSGSNDLVSASLEITWSGLASNQFSNYNFFGGGPFKGVYQTFNYRVDYRAVGATTWIPLQSGAFSGTSYQLQTTNPSGFGTSYTTMAPTGNSTILFQPETVDAYEFRVVKLSGSGSATIDGSGDGPVEYDDISGKTSSKYQRSYRINLPGDGPWDIRVRRITADSTSQSLQNQTFWDSFTEIIDQKMSYPNSAIMSLSVDAERFSSIPVRGYEINGVKVQIPSNYDPISREYDGTWDGTFVTAWSDNPAWIFYDIITNSRYGAGEFIDASLVDKWALYSISQYCDELVPDGEGGEEPRFRCNVYLQKREDAYRVIESLASVFNAVSFWSSGSIFAVQDSPKDPVALFNPSNIIDGQFNYSGSSAKTRSTVAIVAWNDPQDRYRQSVEYVEDRDGILRYGVKEKAVTAIGCTSRGQAHRFGRALLFSERMETETVTFSCGLDGLSILPGEIIQTSDPSRAGKRHGGRIVSATTSEIEIDNPVTIESGVTYTLWCVMPDGSVESQVLSNSTGETSTLTASSAFSSAPQDWSVWVLGASDLNLESWRVLSITETEKATAEITALEYRSDKYDAIENNLNLQPRITSSLNASTQDAVTNLIIEEQLYLINAATVGTSLSVSWTGNATFYEVSWRPLDGNFVSFTTSETAADIQPVTAGEYQVRVTAVNAVGVRSPANTKTIEVFGLSVPPADVSNFTIEAISGNAHLSFDASEDLDVIVGGYLRMRHSKATSGANWKAAVDIGPKVPGSATNAVLPLLSGTYLAKWVDSSGNESESAVLISTTAPNAINFNLISTLTEDSDFLGTKEDVVITDFGGEDALTLEGTGTIDEFTDPIDTWAPIDTYGGIATLGYYYFDNDIDLGLSLTSRLSAEIVASSYRQLELFDDWPDIDTIEVIDGGIDGDASTSASTATLQLRTTDDDPTGSPTWSDWADFRVTDYTARAYEFRVKLETQNEFISVAVTELAVTVDMPDRVYSEEDLTATVSGYSVTYPTEFYVSPALGISAQGMATGDYYEITNKDKTGFDILFKNSGGTAIERTFDYIARAY